MGKKEDIEKEISKLQKQLQVLNRVGEDTYPIGTLVVFSGPSHKWYYAKVTEEGWENLKTHYNKQLREWILEAEEKFLGYFEVYILKADENPIYVKSE